MANHWSPCGIGVRQFEAALVVGGRRRARVPLLGHRQVATLQAQVDLVEVAVGIMGRSGLQQLDRPAEVSLGLAEGPPSTGRGGGGLVRRDRRRPPGPPSRNGPPRRPSRPRPHRRPTSARRRTCRGRSGAVTGAAARRRPPAAARDGTGTDRPRSAGDSRIPRSQSDSSERRRSARSRSRTDCSRWGSTSRPITAAADARETTSVLRAQSGRHQVVEGVGDGAGGSERRPRARRVEGTPRADGGHELLDVERDAVTAGDQRPAVLRVRPGRHRARRRGTRSRARRGGPTRSAPRPPMGTAPGRPVMTIMQGRRSPAIRSRISSGRTRRSTGGPRPAGRTGRRRGGHRGSGRRHRRSASLSFRVSSGSATYPASGSIPNTGASSGTTSSGSSPCPSSSAASSRRRSGPGVPFRTPATRSISRRTGCRPESTKNADPASVTTGAPPSPAAWATLAARHDLPTPGSPRSRTADPRSSATRADAVPQFPQPVPLVYPPRRRGSERSTAPPRSTVRRSPGARRAARSPP